jgi:hypothetical protein
MLARAEDTNPTSTRSRPSGSGLLPTNYTKPMARRFTG